MSEKLVLPKVYEAKEEKFMYANTLPKLSYSQYSSWNDTLYKNQYILGYMFGIQQPGNIFSDFGGFAGAFFESGGKVCDQSLNEETIATLNTLNRPDNAEYEKETVIIRETPQGSFSIQGFIDQTFDNEDGTTVVIDLKTGNPDSKIEYYGSEKYQQTTLYSYYLDTMENKTIGYSGVILACRKGNGYGKHVLRLPGQVEYIPTPYSRERAEKFLLEVDRTAKEISDMYKVFLKVNN
jgi:hypothetical protein